MGSHDDRLLVLILHRGMLILVRLALESFKVSRGNLTIIVLVVFGEFLPFLGNEFGQGCKVNLAMRLAMAALLGAILSPVFFQKTLSLFLGPIWFTPIQQPIAFIPKEKVVG